MKENQLKVSGDKVDGLTEYKQICESEYLVKYNNMVAEYREKKAGLEAIRDRKVEEYTLINTIVNTNTLQLNNKLVAIQVVEMESYLAKINYKAAKQSFSLDFWRKEIGMEKAVFITCDIISYFFRQFTVKESLDGAQMMQLAVKLFEYHSDLRIKELIHCLNEAVLGKYGAFYERISIAKVSEWISQYYENSSANAETEYYRTKPTESRGHNAIDPIESELAKYKKLAKGKKDISDALYKHEKRESELEYFKTNQINQTK